MLPGCSEREKEQKQQQAAERRARKAAGGAAKPPARTVTDYFSLAPKVTCVRADAAAT